MGVVVVGGAGEAQISPGCERDRPLGVDEAHAVAYYLSEGLSDAVDVVAGSFSGELGKLGTQHPAEGKHSLWWWVVDGGSGQGVGSGIEWEGKMEQKASSVHIAATVVVARCLAARSKRGAAEQARRDAVAFGQDMWYTTAAAGTGNVQALRTHRLSCVGQKGQPNPKSRKPRHTLAFLILMKQSLESERSSRARRQWCLLVLSCLVDKAAKPTASPQVMNELTKRAFIQMHTDPIPHKHRKCLKIVPRPNIEGNLATRGKRALAPLSCCLQ